MHNTIFKNNTFKDVVKSFYTSILSQIFSPCGNYLLAGSIYGEIFVFDIKRILNPDDDVIESKQKPHHKFTVDENHQICSMTSTDKFLIVGSKGKITAFEWKQVVSAHPKTPRVAWTLTIPPLKDSIEEVEVNALVIAENGNIYAGCGDKKIHVFSLENGKLKNSLAGHKKYIHDLALVNQQGLASASEDGAVNLWDLRSSKVTNSIHPYKQPRLERPQLGQWVGCVYVENDWLICGGGPRVGLWHLPAMTLSSTFDTTDPGIHAARLLEDRVVIGVADKLTQATLQGDPICDVPCSAPVIYSVAVQEGPNKLMALAGDGPDIDICTNFHYRDQILSCRV